MGLFGASMPRFNFISFALLCCTLLLSACSQQAYFTLKDLPDFEPADNTISAKHASQQSPDLELRKLSKQAKSYFAPFMVADMPTRQKAMRLRNLVLNSTYLDFDYADDKTLTAQQAFDQAQGNCIGFSHLFIALARHYGLKAKYQFIETDPTLVLRNRKISLSIHTNVAVSLPQGNTFIADNVPNPSQLIKRGKSISDKQASALHYNNLAVDVLHDNDYQKSYSYLAKALSYDANLSLLWSNIGAVFRKNNQLQAAEISYKNALALDGNAYAALNNLAVLYHQRGDTARSQYYLKKIRATRERNPYHHYNLALLEIHKQNFPLALKLLKKSIRLKETEAEFHYQQSLIYEKLNEMDNSKAALDQAIDHSQDPIRTLQFKKRARDLISLQQPQPTPANN